MLRVELENKDECIEINIKRDRYNLASLIYMTDKDMKASVYYKNKLILIAAEGVIKENINTRDAKRLEQILRAYRIDLLEVHKEIDVIVPSGIPKQSYISFITQLTGIDFK